MSEKKDQLKEILKDQLNKEAKQIEEEVGLNDNEEIPNELKIRMKNALDQKIREREKRSEDMKRTDAYAKLSEEDQEALRLGREMLKNQSEEKKIYTMRRKKRNIRRVVRQRCFCQPARIFLQRLFRRDCSRCPRALKSSSP